MTTSRRGRGPYPPEFRREALALYRSSGKSLKLIASELGVSVESLRASVKQHDVDEVFRNRLDVPQRVEQGAVSEVVRHHSAWQQDCPWSHVETSVLAPRRLALRAMRSSAQDTGCGIRHPRDQHWYRQWERLLA